MQKSGSYTASRHPYYLSCFRWHAIFYTLSYAQVPSLHSCCEEANKRFFQVYVSPFLLHFPPLPNHRDGTITSIIKICSNLSSASFQNKTFYIFSSVFALKLLVNWVYNTFPVLSQYCRFTFVYTCVYLQRSVVFPCVLGKFEVGNALD